MYWQYATLIIVLLCVGGLARGHELHASRGSVNYSNWINKENKGCCNNQDCHPVAEQDERTQGGTLEVFVRGVGVAHGKSAWCPVMGHHYLSRGNAPNWEVSHACVSGHYGAETPCEQLICYQPKPGF
jgi:hypothetical protein